MKNGCMVAASGIDSDAVTVFRNTDGITCSIDSDYNYCKKIHVRAVAVKNLRTKLHHVFTTQKLGGKGALISEWWSSLETQHVRNISIFG